MKKKMDLAAFDVYKYLKKNFSNDFDSQYILADHETYTEASIRFPFRNFFYGIGLTYGNGGLFQIGSSEHRIQKGSLITIGPGIVSQWKEDSDVPADTILFTEDFLKNFFKGSFLSSLSFFLPGGDHVITLDEEHTAKITLLFKTIKQFKTEPEVVAGITYGLLQLVIKIHNLTDNRNKGSFSVKENFVRGFNSLVAIHFLTHKNVAFYAAQLNITPKYLSEILIAETGKSAKTVIDDTIFMEAKSLLRQTSMSIQEICYHLGFADTSYFTKAFKQREGFTPTEYRNQ
jgi:AraC family transcriptional regulator, transcriptional activator of pobA